MTMTPIDDYCASVDDELSLHEHRSYWATDIVVALGGMAALLLFIFVAVLLLQGLFEAVISSPLLLGGIIGGFIVFTCLRGVEENVYFVRRCRQ